MTLTNFRSFCCLSLDGNFLTDPTEDAELLRRGDGRLPGSDSFALPLPWPGLPLFPTGISDVVLSFTVTIRDLIARWLESYMTVEDCSIMDTDDRLRKRKEGQDVKTSCEAASMHANGALSRRQDRRWYTASN